MGESRPRRKAQQRRERAAAAAQRVPRATPAPRRDTEAERVSSQIAALLLRLRW